MVRTIEGFRHQFARLATALAILTSTSCQEISGNGLGEIVYDLFTPIQIKRAGISRSREKREEDQLIFMNNTIQNNHKYYTSQFNPDGWQMWIDLRSKDGSVFDEQLSSAKLAVKDIKLPFEFPYYGHLVTNATLTSGGFINLGASTKRQIANFQFVAPLMAFFNPSLNDTSTVHYFGDGQKFIVQWSNIPLHENPQAGGFTFQCTLNKTGEIVFSYHQIPIPVRNISNASHAVNMGISDAYYVDTLRHYYGIWQIFRTFYTYDAVHINQSWAVDNAVVILRPKPNCITAKTCEECIERRNSTEFHCNWCQSLERCSDGFDRHRQKWLSSGCNKSEIFEVDKCGSSNDQLQITAKDSSGPLTPWIIAVICLGAIALLISGAWLIYAFTHPNSTSGLWLRQHGPGRVCRKRKEKNQDSGPTNPSVFNKILS